MLKKIIISLFLYVPLFVCAEDQSAKSLNLNQYAICVMNFQVYARHNEDKGNTQMAEAYNHVIGLWVDGAKQRFGSNSIDKAIKNPKNRKIVGEMSDSEGLDMKNFCSDFNPLNWK